VIDSGDTYKQVVTRISRAELIGIFCIGQDERNGPHSRGWNSKPIARSHRGCGRPQQEHSAVAAMSCARYSQPRGEGVLWLSVGFCGNFP